MDDLLLKKQKSENYIKSLKNVAVAFSGGVDSTYLLKVCKDVLGDKVLAITADFAALPQREREASIRFCSENGIRQILFNADSLNKDVFLQNPKNRCYFCKKAIFSEIFDIAEKNGFTNVADGSNIDDDDDYRPGRIALKELGVISPLHFAGLTKQDIRLLSRELNLPTWDKPSFACLATRFEYGEQITVDRLKMVETAEQYLFDLGFNQFRVRFHGGIARIEVEPKQFEMVMRNAKVISKQFKKLGFTYVTMDLDGYRMGSMNTI